MNNWTRKDFLKASLVGGGAAMLAGRTAYGQRSSANGDIRLGLVGINGKGNGHIKSFSKIRGCKIVALCDADSAVLNKRADEFEKDNHKVTRYADYRKLLDDKNIDAVVIATPNHWHSLMTIWACQAGKDVYVEKPLSHNVWEGRQAVEAAKKYNRVVQAGTQNRSSLDIQDAIDYVRAGKLGKIQWARGLCYKRRDSIGRSQGPQLIPSTVNYDLWTGPAWLTPPRRNHPTHGTIHYDWHWFWNYGGGDITNQGIHQMDVARWFLGEPGLPSSVMSIGGRFGYEDDAETPNTQISVYNYKKAPLIFEVRGLPMKAGMKAMDVYRSSRVGVVVQCDDGYVTVSESGTVIISDNNNHKIEQFSRGGNGSHQANFIKAVQDRKVINGLVGECHYSSALCHVGNVSYLVGAEKSNDAIAESIRSSEPTKEAFGRMLEHLKANNVDPESTKTVIGPLLSIDSASEKFVGSETEIVAAANKNPLLKRVGRGAFKIPQLQTGSIAGS